jgi:hypothetical protein
VVVGIFEQTLPVPQPLLGVGLWLPEIEQHTPVLQVPVSLTSPAGHDVPVTHVQPFCAHVAGGAPDGVGVDGHVLHELLTAQSAVLSAVQPHPHLAQSTAGQSIVDACREATLK